jgi:hypothetical protein
MSRRITHVTILAEDKCQQNFAYHFLLRLGVPMRSIKKSPLPLGGAGEQYVRKEYPKEVVYCHQRPHRNLIVLIDADGESVETRRRQLDDERQRSDLGRRAGTERIAVLVPRRNIETWIAALLRMPLGDVDEDQDYKGPVGCERVREAAEAFFDRTRSGQPDLPLDSLRKAVPETRRIEG